MKVEIDFQVHPFLGMNTIKDVIDAMYWAKLDVVALESLDSCLYPRVIKEAKEIYPNMDYDSVGIKLPNRRYLLNAREHNTKENFHILTIGYSSNRVNKDTEIRKVIDEGLENNALIILDHPFVDNNYPRIYKNKEIKLKTAAHISEEKRIELEVLCKEYSGNIALEWNGYCIPWMRKGLMLGLNMLGVGLRYSDVNKEAEKLSERLKSYNYNVPLVADTDLHARKKKHLDYMGAARIITDVEGETGKEIMKSIKKNIFERKYENVKRYVSASHLLEAFCIPILFPKYFKKPRS